MFWDDCRCYECIRDRRLAMERRVYLLCLPLTIARKVLLTFPRWLVLKLWDAIPP